MASQFHEEILEAIVRVRKEGIHKLNGENTLPKNLLKVLDGMGYIVYYKADGNHYASLSDKGRELYNKLSKVIEDNYR